MLFKKKLTNNEKLDFLEYLSFNIKSEMSFEATLARYIENSTRQEHVITACQNTISDIRNGASPADAMLENGYIENLEYGIIKNANSSKDLYISLVAIINIKKNNIKNKNVLESSIRSGLMTFGGIFLLIPFFKDDIAALYGTFGQLQDLTGDGSQGKQVVEVPVLVKYWWSSFVVVGVAAALYQGIKMFFKYLYENHASFYYRIFKNRLYPDLIAVLKTFYQLQESMSVSNSYIALSKSSPNKYWSDLFGDISLNFKKGGKASDVFVSQKGILPVEIIYCFVDAEETGETKVYLDKALDYCETKNETINQQIKEWSPTIINLVLFTVVGLLVVSFVKDIMENGILDVMTKM